MCLLSTEKINTILAKIFAVLFQVRFMLENSMNVSLCLEMRYHCYGSYGPQKSLNLIFIFQGLENI